MISLANQIEIRHLSYFKALAEQLHFRKAAEQLYISQSALSQQIKQLEELLKVTLLERSHKKVALTAAGNLFYQDTLQILNKIEVAVNNLKLWKDGNSGQITIGFVASAMESILPALLKKFNTDCPNIRFQLDELSNQEQMTALQRDTMDLGFMRSNLVPPDMGIQCVYTETFSLVLPIDHKMDALNLISMGQLSDEPFILFPNEQSPLYYQQIINLCADEGFIPKIAHRSIHAPTIFRLVENGMGLSIVPTSLAKGNHPKIKFIELTHVRQKTELFAVWKKQNSNPALPFLLEMLEIKP